MGVTVQVFSSLNVLFRLLSVGLTMYSVAPDLFVQYNAYKQNNVQDLHVTPEYFRYLIPTVMLLGANLISFHPYYGIVLLAATTAVIFASPDACNPTVGVPCMVSDYMAGSCVLAWMVLVLAHAFEWASHLLKRREWERKIK
jgi:hypothetical protein